MSAFWLKFSCNTVKQAVASIHPLTLHRSHEVYDITDLLMISLETPQNLFTGKQTAPPLGTLKQYKRQLNPVTSTHFYYYIYHLPPKLRPVPYFYNLYSTFSSLYLTHFSSIMPHNDEYSLSTFLEQWMARQHAYLHQLRQALDRPQENELREMVIVVLGHYQQYYAAKSSAAREDVFSLFSPPWFSTYERTFLWITGFKPGLAFKIVKKAVNDISEEQEVKLRRLGAQVKRREKDLSKELAGIHESVASVNMVKLTRELGRQLDGATTDVNEELEELRERLQVLVQSADCLRMWTAREVLEILEPVQAVKFLAAAAQLQIRIRFLGQQRDEQRMSG